MKLFLPLGLQPLANSFLHSESDFLNEAKYPLDVYICETCSLVQLLLVIDPEVLFRNYIYVTGTSDTIAAHNRQYAHSIINQLNLCSDDLIVEVASNDGSLLKCFREYGVKVLGVEPATNIANIASENGIETVNRFFNSDVAKEVRAKYGPARVVIGNNVLAHVDATRDFLLGCKKLLTREGMVIIEVPYLLQLLDRLEYDTIYHEHLSYFTVSTLLRLCELVGLALVRVDNVPIHGGSLRMYAGLAEYLGNHSSDVLAMVANENKLGLNDLSRYEKFAADVINNRNSLLELLESLLIQGKNIAAYGAPAKGNTLLNYCGIDTRIIPFTVDKNPLKVGLYTPGMHIPVMPVSALVERQPDYVLILAWNFATEIIQQQQEYRNRGGLFILPNSDPRVV